MLHAMKYDFKYLNLTFDLEWIKWDMYSSIRLTCLFCMLVFLIYLSSADFFVFKIYVFKEFFMVYHKRGLYRGFRDTGYLPFYFQG